VRDKISRTLRRIALWFDASADSGEGPPRGGDRVDALRSLPFVALHLACLAVIWVGWSWFAVGVAVALYGVRMFALTGFYHRYFSHRTFETSRPWQFVFAVLGSSAVQRGPLWWAAHHRKHHRYTDGERDVHSPRQHGLLWSHTLWFLTRTNFRTDMKAVPDLARYPELRWLDRFDVLVPFALAVSLYVLGAALEAWAPGLGTTGPQLLVWGFCISTVVLYHATYTINSLAHRFGRRRYETRDDSRNNFLLALITFGEGWHNNHHYYPASTRQGFYWWEIDLTYYILRVLSWLGIVRRLRPVPARVRSGERKRIPKKGRSGEVAMR
jgi:stearoyl-CoA desaturase (delta-9 desaturase)